MDKAATEKLAAIKKAYYDYYGSEHHEPFTFDGAKVYSAGSGISYIYVEYQVKSAVSDKSLNVTLRFSKEPEPKIMQWALSEGEHGDYGKGNGGDIWNGDIIIED